MGKKTEEKSRRSRAPTEGAGLVRASRPGSLPPTDTDSNALAVEHTTALPLATWTSGRPRVQDRAVLLQSADRPGGGNHDHSLAPSPGAPARGGDKRPSVVPSGVGEHRGDVA